MDIESNVPMPTRRKNNPCKYPFGDMKVGDSVFFEGASTSSKEYVAAFLAGRRHGFRFCGRSMDGGLRIWRIE